MHAFGALGDSLDSAKQTHFFRWFHLEPIGSGKDAMGNEVIEFRPSGEKFHNLVSLKVTCDADGRMLALALVLDREFLDSPQDGVFAADCAKSFLLAATPGEDLPKIKGLADEIESGSFRRSEKPVIMRASMPRPSLPEQPSPGYATYLGRRDEWGLPLAGAQLRLSDGDLDGGHVLVINIARRPHVS
jgi:hypothetical protein